MGIFSGFLSLTKDTNKVRKDNDEEREGASDLVPELKLSMKDDELIALKKRWEKLWDEHQPELKSIQDENEKYWLGNQFGDMEEGLGKIGSHRPMVDNLIFEALETFLPIATNRNPEPTVSADNTEEGIAIADRVEKMLIYQSDRLRIKLRIKRVARYWALYLLGVAKIGWSIKDNNISVSVLRPQKLILDPNATINDDMEYTGEFIGEYKSEPAYSLINRFPKKKKEIEEEVQGELGTKVTYIEWWTDEYLFWTLKNTVLDKSNNPHWNEDSEEKTVDEMGNEVAMPVKGINHFTSKKKPYIFLSIFNLGKHPYDDTSLIGQNLANQDIINKRQKQIDRNIDGMNGGWVISGEQSGLTKEQATMAIQAARKGGGIYIESGDAGRAAARIVGSGLPGDVFNNLYDTRDELRNIFGTRGSSPQGTINEKTVGGKMITKEQDSSRIGGGISEYLEQFADQLYNWMVQMIMVYYDEQHAGAVLGKDKALEYVMLKSQDIDRKLVVSVKPGSMIPKDSVSEAAQMIELASGKLIDPITLFDKLEFPNPRESAERLFIWQTAPQTLFESEGAIKAMNEVNRQKAEEVALEIEKNKVNQEINKKNEPSPLEKPI